jgi:hypothetical protein
MREERSSEMLMPFNRYVADIPIRIHSMPSAIMAGGFERNPNGMLYEGTTSYMNMWNLDLSEA